MKQLFVGIVAGLILVSSASAEQSKKAAKTAVKPKTSAKKQGPITIPKDAKEFAPGQFRWVDSKGQVWIYHQTPFGVMRAPEQPAEAEAPPTDWTFTESGDDVTFTRPWPFGGSRTWKVKKGEMTETERAVYLRAKENAAK